MMKTIRSKQRTWRDWRTSLLKRAAMERKVRAGGFPGCAPVGYRNAWKDGERVIVPDPETAPRITAAFVLASQSEKTLRRLVKSVSAMGLASRNGRPVGVSALWFILKNPLYAGFVRWKGELLPGNHEPLVSPEIFDEVQRVLRSRKRGN